MVSPFTGYRPGVAAIADNKPKPGVAPPGADPMEPGSAAPVTNMPGPPKQPPWQSRYDQLANWARGNMRRPTTYGRNNAVQQQGNFTVAGQRGPGSGGQMYDPTVYGSNYTGPRASIHNLPDELTGNPNVWNQEWMRRYNDWLQGRGPDPRTQAQLGAIPGSGMGPAAPGGG